MEDSCIQSAVICFSGWRIWRISASYRFTVRKGRSILIAFLDTCGYSMIQHQIPTRDSFLKIRYNVESETVSMNFSHLVTLKSMGLSCTLNRPLTHTWFSNTMYWSTGKDVSLSYADLPNVGTLHYTILKNHIITITTNYIRKGCIRRLSREHFNSLKKCVPFKKWLAQWAPELLFLWQPSQESNQQSSWMLPI